MQEELITKFTAILTRKDGSQARIVATQMGGPFRHSVDTYVHRRNNENEPWQLCSDRPHQDWRAMSVDDYVKFGRSEKFRTVTHGEIFKAAGMVGKPMSAVATH
jgi:hypothetical protein